MYFKIVPFPSLYWKGDFSYIYLKNLMEFLEANPTEFWGPLYEWVHSELFKFPHWASSLSSDSSGFPMCCVSHCFPCQFHWCDTVFACISLILRAAICPFSFSHKSRKSCWFFSLFRFLLSVRIEWFLIFGTRNQKYVAKLPKLNVLFNT